MNSGVTCFENDVFAVLFFFRFSVRCMPKQLNMQPNKPSRVQRAKRGKTNSTEHSVYTSVMQQSYILGICVRFRCLPQQLNHSHVLIGLDWCFHQTCWHRGFLTAINSADDTVFCIWCKELSFGFHLRG